MIPSILKTPTSEWPIDRERIEFDNTYKIGNVIPAEIVEKFREKREPGHLQKWRLAFVKLCKEEKTIYRLCLVTNSVYQNQYSAGLRGVMYKKGHFADIPTCHYVSPHKIYPLKKMNSHFQHSAIAKLHTRKCDIGIINNRYKYELWEDGVPFPSLEADKRNRRIRWQRPAENLQDLTDEELIGKYLLAEIDYVYHAECHKKPLDKLKKYDERINSFRTEFQNRQLPRWDLLT